MNQSCVLSIFTSNISYAPFPVINNEAVVESVAAPNRLDTFDIIGWIALGCLALGGILMVLQSILASDASFGGYIFLGAIIGAVGGLLALIWFFQGLNREGNIGGLYFYACSLSRLF